MTTFPINTFFGQIAPELEQLRRQMDEIFETGAMPTASPAPTTTSMKTKSPAVAAWRPRASVGDGGDSYQLQLQLPGIDASQIEIEARRDGVTVRGDRQAPTTDAQPIHSEFRYGAFERSFRLPEEIQQKQVSAAYIDGILTVTLPKRAAAEDYKVKVQVSTAQEAAGETHAASEAGPEAASEEVAKAAVAVTEAPTPAEEPESVW